MRREGCHTVRWRSPGFRLAHPVAYDAPFSRTPQIGPFAGQMHHTSCLGYSSPHRVRAVQRFARRGHVPGNYLRRYCVAKAQVDVGVLPTGQSRSFSHDETGSQELISRMTALNLTMVVLEASGGLELPLMSALATAYLPVVVVNPRQVRDFLPRPRGHWPRPTRLTWRSVYLCAPCGTPRPS